MTVASPHVQRRTSVVVVGGGLVGLSLGLFLQQHRVPFVLIERNNDPVPLPRARGFALRTMEFFRQLGLQEEVEKAAASAWKMGSFGGVRFGQSMLQSEAIKFPEGMSKHMGAGEPSPCKMCACPQPEVEAILKRNLLHRGADADFRFGHEVAALEQNNAEVVSVRIRDTATGIEELILGDYLVAADGGRSLIRHELGLSLEELDPGHPFLNVFFECDLAALLTEKHTFSQCEIEQKERGIKGIFASMNNTDKWVLHLHRDFDPKLDPASLSDEDLVKVIRSAIGPEPIPAIKILNRSEWHSAVRVARAYRKGRAFLAGDAAHNMPPWGGFNGNSGIADAHNIAWRLAAALHADAKEETDAILDGYEQERRPLARLAGTQAALRKDLEGRFGIRTESNKQQVDQQIDGGAILMRYQYGNDTSGKASSVKTLEGQVGTRFPHAWIDMGDGIKRSTLDLFGKESVILAGPEAKEMLRGGTVRTFKASKDFHFLDHPSTQWATLTGTTQMGTILIRPDGFVKERTS